MAHQICWPGVGDHGPQWHGYIQQIVQCAEFQVWLHVACNFNLSVQQSNCMQKHDKQHKNSTDTLLCLDADKC